jgi:hypothetical protein
LGHHSSECPRQFDSAYSWSNGFNKKKKKKQLEQRRGPARYLWSAYVNNATGRHVLCWPLSLPPPSPDTRCTLPKIRTLHLPQAHVMSPGLQLILTYPHRQNDHVWVVHHRHRAPVHYPRRLRGTGVTPTSFKRALRVRCA